MDEQTQVQQARTDRALIARMQKNDADAIDTFYNTYFPTFLRLAQRLTGDFHVAHDLAHDAVLKVILNVESYDPSKGTPRGWFLSILHNLHKDRQRREWVRRAARLSADDGDGGAPLDPPAREPSAHDRVEAREKIGAVQSALMMLHPDDRTLVTMRDYEGLSAADMAAALNLTTELVGSRLYRARQRLRELLETHWPDLFLSRGA